MDLTVQQPTTLRSPSSESSGGSLELERDEYKEKIEHFKVLIRSLQQELHSYKIRKEGTETVSKLLQESRQENQVLQRKNRTLHSAVRNLQSRLENNGLSSDVTLQDAETYIPGCSKQLLDNLTRENNRLRALIRNTSGDPEEVQRLSQENRNLEDHVQELTQGNEQLQSRQSELEAILRSSGDQKDCVIAELRASLERVQRECANRNSLCATLTEEASVLRRQLKEVAQRCQEMAVRLEDSETTAKKLRESSTQSSTNEPGEVNGLKAENQELRSKLTEISQMNNRWQAYSSEREGVLQNRITELKEELKQAQTARSASAGGSDVVMQRAAQEYVTEMNKVLDETRANEEKFQREREQYKRQLEQANAQIYQLAEKSQQLSRQISQSGRRQSREDSEIMEALKQQIQVCTEDFESERRDREKAQARIVKLETENEQLRRELQKKDPRMTYNTPNIGYNDHLHNNYNLPTPQTPYQAENTLAARGVSPRPIDYQNVVDCAKIPDVAARSLPVADDSEETRVVDFKPNMDARDVFLSLRTSSISPVNESRSAQPLHERTTPTRSPPQKFSVEKRRSPQTVEMLKCPKCDKEYHPDRHADLLEHIELCCE